MAMLRRAASAQLTTSAQHYRPTDAISATGEVSGALMLVSASVPCRIIDAGASNGAAVDQLADRSQLVDQRRIVLGYTVDIEIFDVFEIGGVRWRVVNITDQRTDAVDHIAVIERVDG